MGTYAFGNYSDVQKSSFAIIKSKYDIKRLERAASRGSSTTPALKSNDNESKRKREVREKNGNKKRTKGSNKNTNWDPITLATIDSVEDAEKIVTFNKGAHSYFANTLSEYLTATQDFRDPISRNQFTLADIEKIAEVAEVEFAISRAPLLDLFRQQQDARDSRGSQQLQDAALLRDALQGLERLCAETVASMLQCIEAAGGEDSENNDPDVNDENFQEIILLTDIFPSFVWYFGQLVAMDADFADMSLRAWISYIMGPPNRTSAGDWSLKQAVLGFLHDHKKQ